MTPITSAPFASAALPIPTTPTTVPAARTGDPVVVVQQVNRTFKDFWMRDVARAVNSLSFEIYPREVFGLLGPNGSGKSTTIKMMLGLLKPTSGRISVFGKEPTDVAVKKRIGYLPEESYMYGFLNARETLDYYAKLFEIDSRTRARRIDELLDMIGLTGAQFRPVREYSKGMQRRIGIAQALINDPDFLILDEPTTGLDPIGTRQVKELIIQLGKRGKTVLLSSHLLADVEDCVDRLVILYGGQKRAEGACDDLLVSRDRTSIETDLLDEGTVAEVDRVIRARSGGEQAILKVSKPRQSLEALFLDIVERAKAEQVATSGATSGGETAAFLQGAPKEGEALIADLLTVRETNVPAALVPSAASQPAAAPPANGPDTSVITDLLSARGPDEGSEYRPGSSAPPSAPSSMSSPTPANGAPELRPPAVDDSVIGSLLDSPDRPAGERP